MVEGLAFPGWNQDRTSFTHSSRASGKPPSVTSRISAAVRQTTEAFLRARSSRLRTHFDQLDPARAQLRVLRGLLHQARNTRFGVDHDFRRIRTADDYRRLVPLTTRTDLWRDYWEPGAAPGSPRAHLDM